MACVKRVEATSASVPSGVCSANMVLFSVIVDNLFQNNNIIGKKVKFLFAIVDKTAGKRCC
jgi:hypothetical protein